MKIIHRIATIGCLLKVLITPFIKSKKITRQTIITVANGSMGIVYIRQIYLFNLLNIFV